MQILDRGRHLAGEDEPPCPNCGAGLAYTTPDGTTHYRCRSVAKDGNTLQPCQEGVHFAVRRP